ncbi:MAG: hypothetical protein Q9187_007852 [Circinaria calcarea]
MSLFSLPIKAAVRPIAKSISPVPLSITSVRTFSRTIPASALISDAVKHDHCELEEYYDKIVNATDDATKVRYQNAFTWELARHSISEELVVYPALEKYVNGGKNLAEKDRAEHQVVKEKLHKFQNLSPSDPKFMPTIKSLMEDLSTHIKEEETQDLVGLEEGLTTAESEDLSKSFARTKKFVPSRSHPSAPNKPPFETLAGLLATPMDRLGDMFRKFPKD